MGRAAGSKAIHLQRKPRGFPRLEVQVIELLSADSPRVGSFVAAARGSQHRYLHRVAWRGASLCEGQARSICRLGRASAERNGFETYRLLLHEFASRATQKRLLLRQQISNPGFDSSQQLSIWRSHVDKLEEVVSEFETLAGKVVDREELTTIVFSRAPAELCKQWRTTGADYGENYEMIRDVVVKYLAAARRYENAADDGIQPMDVDAVQQERKCFGCGRTDHLRRDCPWGNSGGGPGGSSGG